MRDVMHTIRAAARNKPTIGKAWPVVLCLLQSVTSVMLPTARNSRDARHLQDSGAGFVGALRYGGDKHNAGFGSTSDVLGRGTNGAWGVPGQMPRRRQGLQQSMYLAIPDQGTRVARCRARLHQGLPEQRIRRRCNTELPLGLPPRSNDPILIA
jgi:hypothetical protein